MLFDWMTCIDKTFCEGPIAPWCPSALRVFSAGSRRAAESLLAREDPDSVTSTTCQQQID